MKRSPGPEIFVRHLTASDIPAAGEILFDAFNKVFTHHGYPPPIPDVASGRALAEAYYGYEPAGCFVAVANGSVIGSAFLHRRGDRAGVGPVTVAPAFQGHGVGRKLMIRLIDEVADCASIRLYQDAFNRESFALYARLGFEVRDVMAILRAQPPQWVIGPQSGQRPMKREDLRSVGACDQDLTGIVRPRDLEFLWLRGPSRVIERKGHIDGYAVSFLAEDTLFLGPAAAPDVPSLLELTAAVCAEVNPRIVTIRAPARPGGLLAGLLEAGFAIRSLGTYMVRGKYEDTKGVFLASLFPETL